MSGYTEEDVQVAAYYIYLARMRGEDTGTDGALGDWLEAKWWLLGRGPTPWDVLG